MEVPEQRFGERRRPVVMLGQRPRRHGNPFYDKIETPQCVASSCKSVSCAPQKIADPERTEIQGDTEDGMCAKAF